MHVYGLIGRLPRSRRWRSTKKGLRVIASAKEFIRFPSGAGRDARGLIALVLHPDLRPGSQIQNIRNYTGTKPVV
jgi:hypothetical protein